MKQKKKSEDPKDKLEALFKRPVNSWPYPRIVCFVPLERTMSHASATFPHFWGIAQNGVPLMHLPYGRTDVVRNRAAMSLLQSNYTHILMLDLDHTHPANIAQAFARWIIQNPEIWIVGGLNFRRGEPYDPCCFIQGKDGRFYPPVEWERGLIDVDVIGTGSILIDRRVFETIQPPWFWNDYSGVLEDHWPGEDMGFSQKCRDAGIKMYVDTTVSSPHLIDSAVTEESFRTFIADKGYEIETIQGSQGIPEDPQKANEDVPLP